MERTMEKWDKKSPINGVDKDLILKSSPSYATKDVYLIKRGDRVELIEEADIIRGNNDYQGTDDEVMQQYLDDLNNRDEE